MNDVCMIEKQMDRLRVFFRKTESDKTVLIALLTKVFNMILGALTLLVISVRFSPELQGYYYTFNTLLSLQLFVELGFGTVIMQFASHEWSRLTLNGRGVIEGDSESLSRLASLSRLSMKWYITGGAVLTIILGAGGYFFFSKTPDSSINWMPQWFLLCLLTGVTICFIPVWSLLEGCNQIRKVYTYRFFQAIFSSLSVLVAILSGAGLWTASISSIVTVFCAIFFLLYNYKTFFKILLLNKPIGPQIKWRSEIFPMQWRIAISWASGYFIIPLFTPVLFHYHGAVVAGQMGMTLTVIGLVAGISSSWLAPKVPRFGILIAQKKYQELDSLFGRVTRTFAAVTVVLATAVWFLIYIFNRFDHSLAYRLLPPLSAGIFLLASSIINMGSPFSVYLRAHKKEPLLLQSVVSSILTGVLTWTLGKLYSATGIAVGYLAVNISIVVWVIIVWHHCKNVWHRED